MHATQDRTVFLVAAIAVATCVGCGDDGAGSGATSGSGGGDPTSSAGGTGGTGATGSGGATTSSTSTGPSPDQRRVFVSSSELPGDFGGPEVGDVECQSLADAAGLGGTWKAWLGDGDAQGPADTFEQATVPYVLVGGDELAADWADLIDFSIAVPIDRDETGTPVAESLVWTGTSPFGSCCPPSCQGFTTTEVDAMAGSTVQTEPWAAGNFPLCSESHRLFCFEQ